MDSVNRSLTSTACLMTTVESLLVIGDQYSWILWVTLTRNSMSPGMYNKVMNRLTLLTVAAEL